MAGPDGAGGVKSLEVATSGGEAAQMVKAFAEKLQKSEKTQTIQRDRDIEP